MQPKSLSKWWRWNSVLRQLLLSVSSNVHRPILSTSNTATHTTANATTKYSNFFHFSVPYDFCLTILFERSAPPKSPCEPNPCHNSAYGIPFGNQCFCQCNQLFTGQYCQTQIITTPPTRKCFMTRDRSHDVPFELRTNFNIYKSSNATVCK